MTRSGSTARASTAMRDAIRDMRDAGIRPRDIAIALGKKRFGRHVKAVALARSTRREQAEA